MAHQCESIAFPLISSGTFGYPKDQALKIAISAISDFLLNHEMMVYLVVFDKMSFSLSEKLFVEIEKYIDDQYVCDEDRRITDKIGMSINYISPFPFVAGMASTLVGSKFEIKKRKLIDVIGQPAESFSRMLFRLIDEKGMTDVETYKKANIDRRMFSKLKNEKDYNPSKLTAIAFAIALELDMDTTLDLLGKAGYTLSKSKRFDLIIRFFIENKYYSIIEINEILFGFEQDLLGA